MYTFSNRLKIFAVVLIILGAIGVIAGFSNAHHYDTVESVKELLAEEASHGGHDV